MHFIILTCKDLPGTKKNFLSPILTLETTFEKFENFIGHNKTPLGHPGKGQDASRHMCESIFSTCNLLSGLLGHTVNHRDTG